MARVVLAPRINRGQSLINAWWQPDIHDQMKVRMYFALRDLLSYEGFIFYDKLGSARGGNMADERCVVCGLSVNSKIVVTHKGKQYKLCCYRCKKRFEADAEQYVS